MKTVFQDIRFGIPATDQDARIHAHGDRLAGAGHRRHHGGLQRGLRDSDGSVSIQGAGSHDPHAPHDAVGRPERLWCDRNAMAGVAQIAGGGRHIS